MIDRRFLRRAAACAAWLSCALAIALGPSSARAQAPAVAAAADLQFALAEIAQAFRRDEGKEVRLVFGSSGNFARQIENGAPFELFLSADEGYIRELEAKGLLRDAGVVYAVGRIALFVPRGSPITPDQRLDGLRAALATHAVRRFAIANPEHAPYGRAAREALQHAGLWQAIAPLLVLGENAAQAMQFAASGNSDGGIVPYSLALVPDVADRGTAVVLPESWHTPLRQRMALTRRAGALAVAFYDYLQTPRARAILDRYGFDKRDEGRGAGDERTNTRR